MPDPSPTQQPAIWSEAELPQPQPQPPQPELAREPRFQPINRNQFLLRPIEVEKLVGPDHLVRAIWEMVGAMDGSAYTVEVKAVEGVAGCPPYDPRLLISLWIYAYSQGIASARELERR
jgi:transposase